MNNAILEAKNLVMKFGGLTAVDNASIYVNEGEILGIIGANGAGKTTFFNMISGVFAPTSGTVFFKGKEFRHLKSYKMCKAGIGRTYQICQPFEGISVLQNVMIGALVRTNNVAIAREKSEAILDKLGMSERKNVFGKDLSLPELKRLEMAKALATEPKLLLLDEVLAGLNPTECDNMVDLISELKHDLGVTIIMIEHIMRAIMKLSDRIYVLDQGKIIAEGTPAEVSVNPDVIKSYLGGEKK